MPDDTKIGHAPVDVITQPFGLAAAKARGSSATRRQSIALISALAAFQHCDTFKFALWAVQRTQIVRC